MNQSANPDLEKLAFEPFVEFFFEHPESEPFWYADPQYALRDRAIPGSLLVEHLTRLFSGFEASLGRYSPLQISHGIWAMFSPSFSLLDVLWDSSVPLEKRSQCLRSMSALFRNYAATHETDHLQKCFYMWWHLVVNGFWAQAGQFESQNPAALDAESKTLLETLFETLTEILGSPDPRTQGYALHGLGHLKDPRVHGVVQKYLDQNRGIFTDEHVGWIEQCRDGVVG